MLKIRSATHGDATAMSLVHRAAIFFESGTPPMSKRTKIQSHERSIHD
jgi:hypothetical protein